uniref:Uncharacterized protein n=2 Tax=Zooxanthella nutricula TaxID=1333877 RepID=A0A7S2IZA3_9DINO|mmetsp:Transcript_24167/g.72588  ORF Transcript_24167/g.72588 Transcript_24167/m.72588 type:complete len:234 (+) Transcript_24167:90-791(+)
MGNQFTVGANDVVIYQQGGCSGLCSNPFSVPAFDNNNIDPRLGQHLTPQEYRTTMEACNEVLRVHAPRGWLFLIAMLFAFAYIPIGILAKPATYECTDPNGCVWDCCKRTSDVCDRVTPESIDFRQECDCRRAGKRNICDSDVRVTGDHLAHADTHWMLIIAGVLFLIPEVAVYVYFYYKVCSLDEKMRPAFKEWEKKGLMCRFVRGKDKKKGFIVVTVMQQANMPMVVGYVK